MSRLLANVGTAGVPQTSSSGGKAAQILVSTSVLGQVRTKTFRMILIY